MCLKRTVACFLSCIRFQRMKRSEELKRQKREGPQTFTALFGWFSVCSEGSRSSCEQKILAAFINTNNANMFFAHAQLWDSGRHPT